MTSPRGGDNTPQVLEDHGMSMSAHDRSVLAEMARRLAAQDPALASALSAWSVPAQDPAVARERWVERRWATVRGWQRFPGRVAAVGGLLMVATLLVSAGGSEPVPSGEAEAAIFTEQIPAPATVRVQGP